MYKVTKSGVKAKEGQNRHKLLRKLLLPGEALA
jgi:hypothetical protein